jgi:hypothetical protein
MLTHSLKGAWFQPWSLQREKLGSNVAFEWVNLLVPVRRGRFLEDVRNDPWRAQR